MNNLQFPQAIATDTWQYQLSHAISNIDDLYRYLQISPPESIASTKAMQNFPLRVPYCYAARMEKNNLRDPLLLQVLPAVEELHTAPDFLLDPVGDLQAGTASGVIHKYHGRVLFITAGSCAINCRYCFRRNFPYADFQINPRREKAAIDYINRDSSLHEVILSGGDPLILNDRRLNDLLKQLAEIPHLKRIRIHSRLPIVLPARITPALLTLLRTLPQQIILVVHSNHANEINSTVMEACHTLKQAGVILLNQSVLLKKINDNADALCQLSETLFAAGIMPYYLHLLDKAKGTSHFEVTELQAVQLMRQIVTRLPGYLVPKLVREETGAASKTLLHF